MVLGTTCDPPGVVLGIECGPPGVVLVQHGTLLRVPEYVWSSESGAVWSFPSMWAAPTPLSDPRADMVPGLLLLRRCHPTVSPHLHLQSCSFGYLAVLLFQKCVTEECFFFERLESNNYNTYRSRKYSGWYVALKRTGQYKLGSKTGPGQKAILFLPMSAKSWFTLETVNERNECTQLSLDAWIKTHYVTVRHLTVTSVKKSNNFWKKFRILPFIALVVTQWWLEPQYFSFIFLIRKEDLKLCAFTNFHHGNHVCEKAGAGY